MSPETPETDPVLEHALEIAKALKSQTFTGTSKDGLVSVTVSGAQEALAVKIDPKLFDAKGEQEPSSSACEAFNAARVAATVAAEKTIASLTHAAGAQRP